MKAKITLLLLFFLSSFYIFSQNCDSVTDINYEITFNGFNKNNERVLNLSVISSKLRDGYLNPDKLYDCAYYFEIWVWDHQNGKNLLTKRYDFLKRGSNNYCNSTNSFKTPVEINLSKLNQNNIFPYKEFYFEIKLINMCVIGSPDLYFSKRFLNGIIKGEKIYFKPGTTPTPISKANLKIKGITVKESGSSKSINVYSGQALTLKSGKSYEFKTTIENNGGTTANNINYQILFSKSHNYTNPQTAVYTVSSNNISSISGNSSSSSTKTLYVYDNIGASPPLRSGMTYYLTYDINLNRKIEESNYNDNNFTFNFNYIKTSNKPQCFDCEMLEPYKVQVFDFNGQRVLSKQVSSEAEERLLLSQLPKNRYIVKKNETTIKVNN